IPEGRAAQIFLADVGRVRLDEARVFLPNSGQGYDPANPVGHAMEAVLEALSTPGAGLPSSGRPLLCEPGIDDLCLDIVAAHLLLRGDSREDAELLDRVMAQLVAGAPSVPDVAILERVWRRKRGELEAPLELIAPPMLRASFLLAMTCMDQAIPPD